MTAEQERAAQEPLAITLTGMECLALHSATSWLFGFMEGIGRPVPPFVASAFAPIERLAHHEKDQSDD
jgi:hypothetical protein